MNSDGDYDPFFCVRQPTIILSFGFFSPLLKNSIQEDAELKKYLHNKLHWKTRRNMFFYVPFDKVGSSVMSNKWKEFEIEEWWNFMKISFNKHGDVYMLSHFVFLPFPNPWTSLRKLSTPFWPSTSCPKPPTRRSPSSSPS